LRISGATAAAAPIASAFPRNPKKPRLVMLLIFVSFGDQNP
jgi:hypothetical protein